MKYSVSVHNGSKCNVSHNNRDKESIYTQRHIRKAKDGGEFEIWKSEKLKDTYDFIFGEAVADYNENQKRNDRKIKNYFDKIESGKDKKNNPKLAYELIVSIGNMEHCIEDKELNKKILKEYFEKWAQRNPNLKLFNVTYHNDEIGVPHIHIDYVPVAHYNKGLKIRNSLNRALNEQGFEDDSFSNTPIIRWQKSEQQELMKICSTYGVDTEILKSSKREHLEKEEYIAMKKKETLEKDINNLKEQNEKQKDIINRNADTIYQQEEIKEQQEKEIKEQEKEVFQIQDALNNIDEEIKKYKIENAQYKTNFINYFNNLITNYVGFCDYQEREKIVNTLKDYIENVGNNFNDIDNKENSMSELISIVKLNTKSNAKQKQNDFDLEL